MEKMSQRMKMKTVESLVCMVKSVENQYTNIDLQNESSVYGFVKEVDWYNLVAYSDMNITLHDVTITDPNGNQHTCNDIFLKSRMIRYVHLSRTVDVFQTMKDVRKQIFPAKVKKLPSYSLKKKKITANQEILKREVQSLKIKNSTNNL